MVFLFRNSDTAAVMLLCRAVNIRTVLTFCLCFALSLTF